MSKGHAATKQKPPAARSGTARPGAAKAPVKSQARSAISNAPVSKAHSKPAKPSIAKAPAVKPTTGPKAPVAQKKTEEKSMASKAAAATKLKVTDEKAPE